MKKEKKEAIKGFLILSLTKQRAKKIFRNNVVKIRSEGDGVTSSRAVAQMMLATHYTFEL